MVVPLRKFSWRHCQILMEERPNLVKTTPPPPTLSYLAAEGENDGQDGSLIQLHWPW